MISMEYKTIKVEKEEQIATLTINRPEKKNAMNPQFDQDMVKALEELRDDDDTRVVIITGAGDTFCGGRDLKEFFADTYDKPMERLKTRWKSGASAERLRLLPKPTIAAVNGPVYGGGLRLMCSCDLVIASEKAIFVLSEINFGIFPSGGVTKVMVDCLSHRDALYLILTGDPIDAFTAERWRLVNKVVPHDKLKEETVALARKLKSKNPIALMLGKEVFWASKYMHFTESVAWELAKSEELSRLQGGEWVREGIGKFLAKKYKPGRSSYLEVK